MVSDAKAHRHIVPETSRDGRGFPALVGLWRTRFRHTCAMPPTSPDEPAEGLSDGILQAGPTEPAGEEAELLTFLFADIRGYARFTQQRGDEAAAKLTGKFAAVVRDLVAEFGGTVFELRGDEAMCVAPGARPTWRKRRRSSDARGRVARGSRFSPCRRPPTGSNRLSAR
jgi:class 3 adenylate cyclase